MTNMDEPQITEQATETDADTAKSEENNVLNSDFENEDLKNAMSTDDALRIEEPSTSGDVVLPKDASENIQSIDMQPVGTTNEDAGPDVDITIDEFVDEPPDNADNQAIFDKPSNQVDETVESEIDNDNLDYTEQSINISQLHVEPEHHDDSNDAFNALKESETDALQEPKEEESEQKEEEQNPEDEDKLEEVSEILGVQESAVATVPMEVDSIDAIEDQTNEAEGATEREESHEAGADNADVEGASESLGSPASLPKPDNEDAEEVHEGKKLRHCS